MPRSARPPNRPAPPLAPRRGGRTFSTSTPPWRAGRLRVTWTYSENVHRRETVEALADSYLRALRELIAHCLAPEAGGYTSSDFKLAGLDQRGLDKVLGKAGRSRERGLSLPHRDKDATR